MLMHSQDLGSPGSSLPLLGIFMRMREYAIHADYAHIRKDAEADENLIHIIHI